MALAKFQSNLSAEEGLFAPYDLAFEKSVLDRWDLDTGEAICKLTAAGGYTFVTSDNPPYDLVIETSPEVMELIKADPNFTWIEDILNDGSCPDWVV